MIGNATEAEVRNRNNGAFTEDKAWIGVDLDGTLAVYDGWKGLTEIGAPVPAMIERVKKLYAEGKNIRIFTARVGPPSTLAEICLFQHALDVWCFKYIGTTFPATHEKDFNMIDFYDDRCKQVAMNTGEVIEESLRFVEKQLFSSILLITQMCTALLKSSDAKVVAWAEEMLLQYDSLTEEYVVTDERVNDIAKNGVKR